MAGTQTQVYNVIFQGEPIRITVTSSGAAVKVWLDEVLPVRRRGHKLVVGLDVEWRPTFSSACSRTTLLQLCVGRRCLIFQLIHADNFPRALVNFLGDSDYRFVGVGVKDDADRLLNDWGLEVVNKMDMAKLAVEGLDHSDLRGVGLKAIGSVVMGVDMDKLHRVRIGPWDAYSLSREQIKCACIDLFVSFEIGRILLCDQY
jgi:hypothetical protein